MAQQQPDTGSSDTADPDESAGRRGTSGAQRETDEVFKVETHGIDPIPDDERHGSARDVFWLWFGSNLTYWALARRTVAATTPAT
ncbi:hypothetical protein ACO0M4_35825 [Streptomyces sp. RGM 3693]|uniref:hypothetical protein n=1 Tax=Streptomyces sp. RGM 3693 TaxID=3413284 RepID=UPI003D28ADAE